MSEDKVSEEKIMNSVEEQENSPGQGSPQENKPQQQETPAQEGGQTSLPTQQSLPTQNFLPRRRISMTLRRQFSYFGILCLIYAVSSLLFIYHNFDGIGNGIFTGIGAGLILLGAKRLKEHPADGEEFSIEISTEVVFYFVAAIIISFGNCLTDNGTLLVCNHIATILLFSIASIKLFYRDEKWDFAHYSNTLCSFWLEMLSVVPVPFSDFSYYRKKKEKKYSANTKAVLLGVLIGLPILLVVTELLVRADETFANLLGDTFHLEEIVDWFFYALPRNVFGILLLFGFYLLLLYLLFAALCRGELRKEVRQPAQYNATIAVTVFTMIDVVYVLFSGVQFLYLFDVPVRLDYAGYARQGFFELLFVAVINFVLVLFCNQHFPRKIALKITMTITCACTFVMTVSATWRMHMYIQAYHLTFLRVFVLWFLLLLSLFMAGSTISIYREGWNSFRYCLFLLTCLYLVLALSNVDGRIANYNVAKFEQDFLTCQEQASGERILPNLKNYLPDDYSHSKAYASALRDLRENYGETLGKKNCNRIDEYLTRSRHFKIKRGNDGYSVSRSGDDTSAIYDFHRKKTLFQWRHFNFVEYHCYRLCND